MGDVPFPAQAGPEDQAAGTSQGPDLRALEGPTPGAGPQAPFPSSSFVDAGSFPPGRSEGSDAFPGTLPQTPWK